MFYNLQKLILVAERLVVIQNVTYNENHKEP